jgi:hypothetical protein
VTSRGETTNRWMVFEVHGLPASYTQSISLILFAFMGRSRPSLNR